MAVQGAFVTLLLALALLLPGGLVPGSASPPAAAAEGPPLAGAFAQSFKAETTLEPAPEIVFTDIEGQPAGLGDFKGRVVLLNFWATWCAPCVREMPSLDRLHAKLEAEGLTVVALSMDRKGRTLVEPFVQKLDLQHLQVYLDPKSKAARAFGVGGLPASYVIDAEGRLAGSLLGPAEWDDAEAIELMRYYLAQRPGAGGLSAEQSD